MFNFARVVGAALLIALAVLRTAEASGLTIRGVDLGGWFVLEPWITPSIFDDANADLNTSDIVDEWTLCEFYGKDKANEVLQAHWDSWVTFDDLQTLADAGINAVRIPVGYWMFGAESDEPWAPDGSYSFLVRGLGWIESLGMKALIDLHGAPGSQNGFDNSGKRGGVYWADDYNISRTLQIMNTMSANLSDFGDVIFGIELVNEPRWDIDLSTVQDYYMSGYWDVTSNTDYAVVIHDSFRFNDWSGFMQPPTYQNVYFDTHIYQAFDDSTMANTYEQHLEEACSWKSQISASNSNLWTVVGEWSLATTDCATYLNGYGVGARYDGTMSGYSYIGSCDRNDYTTFTDEYKDFLREFAETQMDAYGAGQGWFFWNFKAESGAPQWSYLLGLQEGWIPANASDLTYTCN